MTVIKGQTSDLRAWFPNASGILEDPDHVHLEVVAPDQTVATYVYGASSLEVQRVSAGIYDGIFVLDSAGEWDYTWVATGGVQGGTDGQILVRPPYTERSTVPTNSYSDLERVQAQQPGRRLTASSTPNTMEVSGFLTMTAAEINSILRARGYVTPIASTSPEARELMTYGNTLGAAALVEQSAINHGDGKPPAAVLLWENFKKALKAGELEPDAPKDETVAGVRHGGTGSAFFTRCLDT